eukprot:scpid92695/ scgid22550/ 
MEDIDNSVGSSEDTTSREMSREDTSGDDLETSEYEAEDMDEASSNDASSGESKDPGQDLEHNNGESNDEVSSNDTSSGESKGPGPDLENNNEESNYEDAASAILTVTQEGGYGATHHGYSYRKDKKKADGRITWRCTRPACGGRLTTAGSSILEVEEDNIAAVTTEDNHPPIPEQVEVRRAVSSMKRLCRQGGTGVRTIIRRGVHQPASASCHSFAAHSTLWTPLCLDVEESGTLHCLERVQKSIFLMFSAERKRSRLLPGIHRI